MVACPRLAVVLGGRSPVRCDAERLEAGDVDEPHQLVDRADGNAERTLVAGGVYPELAGQTVEPNGVVLVAAPGNPNGQYRFRFDAGVVRGVTLQLVNQGCRG
ncbi:hypothetical protein [Actinophytocola oryzae]|uniref:Uncharacterized protein n=1 Tax=Actinophytocola oryzae TaxID=502181 RepID=A0A4R7W2H8_9PSEU|nr:hypothetical protein [Actinophytocola oryzae]TDV56089.1 hypothetical protein CLV71_102150 [Actinophytocola oryzae]